MTIAITTPQLPVDAAGGPTQVAFDGQGYAYVSYANRLFGLRKYRWPSWDFVATIWTPPGTYPDNGQIFGVAYSDYDDRIYATRNGTELWSMERDGSDVITSTSIDVSAMRNLTPANDGIGSFFVGDGPNNVIEMMTNQAAGFITFRLPDAPNQATTWQVALDPDGRLHVPDGFNGVVQVFEVNPLLTYVDEPVETYGTPGNALGQLTGPFGIAINSTSIFVADRNRNRVLEYDLDTKAFLGEAGIPYGVYPRPTSLAFDPNGDLILCDGAIGWNDPGNGFLWGPGVTAPGLEARGISAEICGPGPCEGQG